MHQSLQLLPEKKGLLSQVPRPSLHVSLPIWTLNPKKESEFIVTSATILSVYVCMTIATMFKPYLEGTNKINFVEGAVFNSRFACVKSKHPRKAFGIRPSYES